MIPFDVEFSMNFLDGQYNFVKDSLILLCIYPSIYSSRYSPLNVNF